MASILQRFKDIMSANVNAALDKMEDPSKMIDQYLRNMESDLGKVKAETASVMAEESRARRAYQECEDDMNKMQAYAEKAVMAGNDADAREFLAKKQKLSNQLPSLKQMYELAAENAIKMREMHDKLVRDIAGLNSRKDSIKAKISVAKTQDKINKIGSGMTGVSDNMSAFDKIEAKADKMLDEANAMAELNASSQKNDVNELMNKYDKPADSSLDDELAALKSKLGQ